MKDLLTILTTYEGALQEANEAPDDDKAVANLEAACKDLMDVLTIAKRWHDSTGGNL